MLPLKEKGDINGSIEYYRLAIDLKRDMSLAWLKLGGALTDIHQQDEAIAAYEVHNPPGTIYRHLLVNSGKPSSEGHTIFRRRDTPHRQGC